MATEDGRDSAAATAEADDHVSGGVLRPWGVGDLPAPPVFRIREWKSVLGPGLLLAGASVAAGEWLFGPAITAQYGTTLIWLATISIVCQGFINVEMMRYALYTGESVFVGYFRTRPGPWLWTICYLLLDSYSIWPFMASNAAVPLAAAFLGHLPGAGDVTVLGMLLTESQLVKILGYLVFLAAFIPLVFGGAVYRMIEQVMSIKIVVVLSYFAVLVALTVSATVFWDVITGFLQFGMVPFRAETIVAGPHFTLTRHDGESLYTIRGTLEKGVPLVTSFVVASGKTSETYEMGAEVPSDARPNFDSMLSEALSLAGRERFFVQNSDENGTLGVEGQINPDSSWRATRYTVRRGDREEVYNTLEQVPEPEAAQLRSYVRNQGVVSSNLFGYLVKNGQFPPLDWALLAAFASIAGAGGLSNALLSNYARDKGWGMGAHVGAIPSAVGGHNITLSHVGKVFRLNPESLARWRGWVRHVVRDQFGIWMVGSFVGMALPCMISLQFIRNAPVVGDRVAAMTAAAMAEHYPSFDHLLWFLTLLCGFLVLAPGQVFAADCIARRWTDVLWVTSRRAQRMGGNQVKYIYYGILVVYGIWGLFALAVFDPLQIAKLGAGLGNIALGFTALHTLFINRTLLPRELRPRLLAQFMLLLGGVFFISLSLIAWFRL